MRAFPRFVHSNGDVVRPWPGLAALTCVAAVACTPPPDEGPTTVEAASLVEPPTLVLGDETGGVRTFGRIAGVGVLGDSLLVVVDQTAAELRFFRLDGTHVRTRGGHGDGPGEFTAPRLLGLGRADSLIVLDGGRIHLLNREGEWSHAFPLLSETQGEPAQALAALDDGRVVVQLINLALGPLGDGDVLTDTTRLALVSPGRALQLLGPAATPAWLLVGQRRVPIPFAPTLTVTTSGARVISLIPDGSAVVVFGASDSTAIWSSPSVPGAASEADWDDELRRLQDRGVPSAVVDLADSLRGSEVVPELRARYDLVVASTLGEIWARQSRGTSAERAWDVFSPDGQLLGGASTPRAFSPHHISDRLMVGVLRGPLGTESVLVYQLARE